MPLSLSLIHRQATDGGGVQSSERIALDRAGFSNYALRRTEWDLSVGRNREVHRNVGLGFDGFGAQVVRFEPPLADRVFRGIRQNARAADDVQILNDAIFTDQRSQYDRALHFHLPRQHGISRFDGMRDNRTRIGRHVHPLGGIVGHVCCRLSGSCCASRLREPGRLRGRARLQVDVYGIAPRA